MALTRQDLKQVEEFVQSRIASWLPIPALQLNERIVRVEEELRHQRELMIQGFAHVDKRFEDMDKRFSVLTWMIGIGFVVITSLTTTFTILS